MKTNQTAIGMLRQWLNEDRIDDPKKMVTNEQIEMWLALDPLKEEGEEIKFRCCTWHGKEKQCECTCHQEKETTKKEENCGKVEKSPQKEYQEKETKKIEPLGSLKENRIKGDVIYQDQLEPLTEDFYRLTQTEKETPKKLPSHEIEKIHSRMFYSQDKNDERGECELWRDSILEYLDETAKERIGCDECGNVMEK